ncbi:MAG TPA: hypothetical protein VHB53_12975, partial [Solirubrobacterales bacterium]|nr:hypothetical protein [Solirubrobacterales bacterium]
MEIACVIDCRLAAPERPGRSGGLRPGREALDDPVAAAEMTEAMVRTLEGIGAGVETERAGEIFFAVGGLRGLHGGEVAGVTAAARQAVGVPVLIGVGPTRTAARAAAERGETVVTRERLGRFLAPLPTAVLVDRLGEPEAAAQLVASLERLGIATLGALRRLTHDQVADRFGPLGLRALRIARGEDEALRPRVPHADLV